MDKKFKETGFAGLHGIPVMLKDNVDTGDMETTAGLKQGVIPPMMPFLQESLRKGAIILAKVNLHEFAVWGDHKLYIGTDFKSL